MKLSAMSLLVVDAQSTGASPERGHLLELGWQLTAPDGDGRLRAIIARLPKGESVPHRVSRITGITGSSFHGNEPWPAELWWIICAAAKGCRRPSLPLLAHYAAFERRWLAHMAAQAAAEPDFQLICTREISRRLFPGLPRKGLRSVAGHLGMSLPRYRRAAEHVRATNYIWRKMVPRLEAIGVRSFEDLLEFLGSPPPSKPTERRLSLPRERLVSLPGEPGVYRLLAADGRVLYVGKASNLRSRVASYFAPGAGGEKILALASQVTEVEETPCGSPFAAAVLETCEIHRLDPPYNKALRPRLDDSVIFCSPDFQRMGMTPRSGWRGPFLGPETARRMRLLVRSASVGRTCPALSRWIRERLERDRPPVSREVLLAGLQLLLERAGCVAGPGMEEKAECILGLGRKALNERRLRREDGASAEEPEEGEEVEMEPAGPEEVLSALLSIAAAAAHRIELGNLCRLMGDSTVSWRSQAGSGSLVTRNWSGVEGWPPSTPKNIPPVLRCRLAAVVAAEARRVLRAGGDFQLKPLKSRPPSEEEVRQLVGLP